MTLKKDTTIVDMALVILEQAILNLNSDKIDKKFYENIVDFVGEALSTEELKEVYNQIVLDLVKEI